MSITCDWVSACQMAIIDRMSGRVTLVHVLDAVASQRFPAQIPTFHVVASWQNHTEMVTRARLQLSIEEFGGETTTILTDEEVAFAGRTSHRSVCIVQSLTVLRPGAYRVVARWQAVGSDGWIVAGAHPFSVNTSAAPAGPAMA